MDTKRLRHLLAQVRAGEVDPEAALESLKHLPFRDLGFARVDHHRALRQGVPEVILGEGKTVEQMAQIVREQIHVQHNVLITRLRPEPAASLLGRVPELSYHEVARVATYEAEPAEPSPGAPVALVTAGTSDLPVAEEAAETLRMLRIATNRIFDVGVAGIHRLAAELDDIAASPAAIVVAGMEGALASVVGGLVACPVIAVPTSIGYGVALGGLTPLFGMLSGCAAGVTVVNIDNGFGAAMAVYRIMERSRRVEQKR